MFKERERERDGDLEEQDKEFCKQGWMLKTECVKGDNLIFCSKRKRERDGDLEDQDEDFGKQR